MIAALLANVALYASVALALTGTRAIAVAAVALLSLAILLAAWKGGGR